MPHFGKWIFMKMTLNPKHRFFWKLCLINRRTTQGFSFLDFFELFMAIWSSGQTLITPLTDSKPRSISPNPSVERQLSDQTLATNSTRQIWPSRRIPAGRHARVSAPLDRMDGSSPWRSAWCWFCILIGRSRIQVEVAVAGPICSPIAGPAPLLAPLLALVRSVIALVRSRLPPPQSCRSPPNDAMVSWSDGDEDSTNLSSLGTNVSVPISCIWDSRI